MAQKWVKICIQKHKNHKQTNDEVKQKKRKGRKTQVRKLLFLVSVDLEEKLQNMNPRNSYSQCKRCFIFLLFSTCLWLAHVTIFLSFISFLSACFSHSIDIWMFLSFVLANASYFLLYWYGIFIMFMRYNFISWDLLTSTCIVLSVCCICCSTAYLYLVFSSPLLPCYWSFIAWQRKHLTSNMYNFEVCRNLLHWIKVKGRGCFK